MACLYLVSADTVNVDWKYGMEDTDTAVCVPPGKLIIIYMLYYISLLGTIINFEWETNHNVVEVGTMEDFDTCTGFTDTEAYEGPLAWPVPEAEGTYYIICGVKTHCADGNQKIAVTVGAC